MVKKRYWCVSTKHLQITTRGFPVGLAYHRAKIVALDMEIYQSEENKAG